MANRIRKIKAVKKTVAGEAIEPDIPGCHNTSISDLQKMDAEAMAKYGWIVHFVHHDYVNAVSGTNYHTHGLVESWAHPDLQITLPLAPKLGHAVLCRIVDQIKEGKKFEAGKKYPGIVNDTMDVTFKEVLGPNGAKQNMLRVIIPDAKGCIEQGKMESPYDKQWIEPYEVR